MAGTGPAMTDDLFMSPMTANLRFHFAFDLLSLLVVIYSNTKAESPKRTGDRRGSARWTGYSTSPSSEAASTAAASRAMRRGGGIPFFYVK
jgi:hypothetical protein